MASNILGKNLDNILTKLGWSQTDLAARIGKSTGYVSKIISGDSWVSSEALIAISNQTGASLCELFQDDKQPSKTSKAQPTISEAIRAINAYQDLFSIKLKSGKKATEPKMIEVMFSDGDTPKRGSIKAEFAKAGFNIDFAATPRESWGKMTKKLYDVLIVHAQGEGKLLHYRHLELISDYNRGVLCVLIDSDPTEEVLKVCKPHLVFSQLPNPKKLAAALLEAFEKFQAKSKASDII